MPAPSRKAILIGAGYPDWPTGELPGTFEDIKNLKGFLHTYGGFQEDTEIVLLNNYPQRNDVLYQLNSTGDIDYLLVYFSGHGFLDGDGETWLQLADGPLAIHDVKRHATRQLNIFDCCRTASTTFDPNSTQQDGPVWNVPPPTADIDSNRNLFNELLASSGHGEITLFSCSPWEYAFSGPELGSRFTYGLTKTALAALANGYAPVELTVRDVFSLAEHWVKGNSGEAQKPTIESDQIDFPFAVLV